jgi:iron uptake system component EfeO
MRSLSCALPTRSRAVRSSRAAARHAMLPCAVMTAWVLGGCSSDDATDVKTDDQYQTDVVTGMHATLATDVQALHQAAVDLQAAAPTPAGRGWDATADATALQNLTTAWLRARSSYERTEGALAPIFPDIDAAIDARYEDFLESLAPNGDQDLFDGEGVTGMHAIERILFVNTTPASVISVESSLPGYKAAAFPATAAEAADFKNALAAQLVDDTEQLEQLWRPETLATNIGEAFQGLIALMNEQREKVNKAASEEEESRYAQRTMADIRDNLAGTRRVYELFQPWLETKADGVEIDAKIVASFDDLDAAYATVSGPAIPAPPATWSSEAPSAADLQSPFGKLYTAIQSAVDPNEPGSAVEQMNRAALTLGFDEYVEE